MPVPKEKILYAVGVIVTMMMIVEKRKHKAIERKKRMWTKKWIRRRMIGGGILNMLNQELLIEDPVGYKNFLRMNNVTFEKLLRLISNKIKKQDTQFRESISARSRFL